MAENYIDKDGLHTQTITEIKEALIEGYKGIYGDDITVTSDSPDGQRINIEAQAKADLLDFSKQVYNCFDVDSVIGDAQDRLYKINNVYRQNADYSYVAINVTVNQPVNLDGLDENVLDINGTGYTVSDEIGNNFILVNSVSLSSAGTYSLEFRAEKIGAVDVSPNTIIVMVTVIAGVVSVNNPAKQYLTGATQETDSEFRIKRNKSTAISAQGFYDAMEGQFLNIPNVTSAKIYENTPDNHDIPQSASDSAIWCIVEGGLDSDIAAIIYANRTFGCAMVGNTSATVQRADGTVFTAYFDRPSPQSLYMNITINSRQGLVPDEDYIKKQLVERMKFGINEQVTSSDVVIALNDIDSSVYVESCTLSNDGVTFDYSSSPTTKDKYFTLATSDITITIAGA